MIHLLNFLIIEPESGRVFRFNCPFTKTEDTPVTLWPCHQKSPGSEKLYSTIEPLFSADKLLVGGEG